MTHPDQSEAAIRHAREHASACPAPPRGPSGGLKCEPASMGLVEPVVNLNREATMMLLKFYGFDVDSVAVLKKENAALKSSNVDLLARARIAEEAAANAVRELKAIKKQEESS